MPQQEIQDHDYADLLQTRRILCSHHAFFGRAVAERPVVSPHFGANQRKASIEKPEIDRFLENPAILVLPVQVHSDTGFNLFA